MSDTLITCTACGIPKRRGAFFPLDPAKNHQQPCRLCKGPQDKQRVARRKARMA
jgi:hypothetical protein